MEVLPKTFSMLGNDYLGCKSTSGTRQVRSTDIAGLRWSGRRESNPHDQLGRLGLCH